MKTASSVLQDHHRLRNVLGKVYQKMLRSGKESKLLSRLQVIFRMVKAYANGKYREVPWKSILLLTGGLVYFLMPIDLVPDFIPVTGYLDDLTIILWIYNALEKDIQAFMEWEDMAGKS